MRWIPAFLLCVAFVVIVHLFGLLSTKQILSAPIMEHKPSNFDFAETEIPSPTLIKPKKQEERQVEVNHSQKQYDWRLDFWTKEQLDAFEKSHKTVDLTEQEKADAFAYRVIDMYQYAVCNPDYHLYQPSPAIRSLILGRETERSIWIDLLYHSDPATRVKTATMLGYELDNFSESDQNEIRLRLKKSYHLFDKAEKHSAIYSLLYMADSHYQYFKENSRLEFEWGYGAILAELNPNSNLAKRMVKLATSEDIDVDQAKLIAYRELEELRNEMDENEFETVSFSEDIKEYATIFYANDSRAEKVNQCNKWKSQYQQAGTN